MLVVSPVTATTRTTRILFVLHPGCFFLILLSFNIIAAVAAVSPPPSFRFNFSNTSSYNKSDLQFQGDAGQNGDLVDLTCNAKKTEDNVNCKGRMWYNHPVLFYDNKTGEVASFTTSFTFVIQPISGIQRGDGMTFFLAGYPLELPRSTSGDLLGLTDNGNQNVRTISNSSKFIAVEFDTFPNGWDRPTGSTDHIGIDLSSLTSVNVTKLPTNSLTGTMTATITFNGSTRMLEAYLHFDSNRSLSTAQVKTRLPEPLGDLLPPEVSVGFSASTGVFTELHQILSWSFNSSMASKEILAGPNSVQPVVGTKDTTISLAIVLPTVVAALATIFLCIWYVRRKIKWQTSGRLPLRFDDLETVKSSLLSLSSIQEATNNFDKSMKLGEGGFGEVYKGVLISGQEVAVKRLSKNSNQGIEEVKNELVLAAKLHHKNLVQLVGFCLEEGERLLVYEYMPNKSLDTILFDPEKKGRLDWEKRFNVIEGVARGLQYLHEDSEEKIIHRDLKASNVLLDAAMNPKIGDFGLARLFGQDQTRDVTSHIAGTFGYMSPEYVMCGRFSIKSDVFSFGILVVEIITGLRNNGSYFADQNEDVISTVWKHWAEGTVTQMVDNSLEINYPRAQVLRCLHVGLLCLQQNPLDRPTMWEIMVMLDNNNDATTSLPAPTRPTFFIDGSSGYSHPIGAAT